MVRPKNLVLRYCRDGRESALLTPELVESELMNSCLYPSLDLQLSWLIRQPVRWMREAILQAEFSHLPEPRFG